ncbi:TPA: hypothetical protein ENS27_19880 [bacterium]|nr:hypothetical protein [bacterium]
MKKLCYFVAVIFILNLIVAVAWAAKSDCGKQPNAPAKPIKKVAKNDPNVQNDYDKEVKEDTRTGVVYLAPVGGAQPKANACGLKASNPPAEMAGWGGPLDGENMTIGEGAGSRNEIVIGGTYFERGFGTHAAAKFVFPLTGDKYTKLECYVGMSDEKDPAECGNGGSSAFIFTIDGKEMAKTPTLKGTDGGKDVDPFKVAFDIPSGAKELVIQVTDGGDGNSCDHSAIGDPKLFTTALTAVTPEARLSTTWGELKSIY